MKTSPFMAAMEMEGKFVRDTQPVTEYSRKKSFQKPKR